MKLPKCKPEDLERERMMYAGICPKCNGRIILMHRRASDGCWSEDFECECGYFYPNQSMCCNKHNKEVEKYGFVVSEVKELSNMEHYKIEPLKEKEK